MKERHVYVWRLYYTREDTQKLSNLKAGTLRTAMIKILWQDRKNFRLRDKQDTDLTSTHFVYRHIVYIVTGWTLFANSTRLCHILAYCSYILHSVSVLFLSRPRSEGWPHHRRTFSIYLYPLSFWLTLPQRVLSTTWCCLSRPCVVFLAWKQ